MSEAPIRLTNPPTGPSPEFWEGEHKLYDSTGKYHNLSGYGVGSYNDILKIHDLLAEARTVLEIGVGTAQAIKDMVAMGKSVAALDCCPAALARAFKAGAGPISAPKDLPVDYFDLITCHLVSQHLPDSVLLPLLTSAIRSLMASGVLAIQCADVPGRERIGYQFVAAGNILRSEQEMTDLLKKAGAHSVKTVGNFMASPADGVIWLGFHARRAP